MELLSVYRESEDIINIGAYSPGSNPKIDEAVANIDIINAYLRQDGDFRSDFESARHELAQLCDQLGAPRG